jgi:membrane-bound lytic murein transglycosylase C
LFGAENNIKPGAACPGILAYEQLDGVDARMSRDYCVISAYNTGSSYVMKTFSGEKDKQLFEDGLQRINSLDPSQVFQTLHEKLAYEETGNYLSTVNTNRKRYYSVDKTVVADNNKPSSAP